MDLATSCVITVTTWLIMMAHARYQYLSSYMQRIIALGMACVAARGIWRAATMAIHNTLHPPEWDFLIFWINGVAATRGLNFYDPIQATYLAAPFHPSDGFAKVALFAPFLYPPPSIVWFAPLGWLDIHTAATVWYVTHFGCLAGSVWILSKTFFRGNAVINVVFTTALIVLVHAMFWNIATAQTNFLLLLFLSLAFRDRDKTLGGVWLALAILVKPFVIVLTIPTALRGHWRSLIANGLTLVTAAVGTLLIYGRTVFADYFAIPFQHLPMSMYTEIENQSLLAWVLRITHSEVRFSNAYLTLTLLLMVFLFWRLSVTKSQDSGSGFALALIFGLLLYPASLRSYTVVLILPILVLYSATSWLLVAFAYGLMYLAQGNYVCLATLALGTALAILMPDISGRYPSLTNREQSV